MWGGLLSKVNDLKEQALDQANQLKSQVEASFDEAIQYDPENRPTQPTHLETQDDELLSSSLPTSFALEETAHIQVSKEFGERVRSPVKMVALQETISDDFFSQGFDDDDINLKETQLQSTAQEVCNSSDFDFELKNELVVEQDAQDLDFEWGPTGVGEKLEVVEGQCPATSDGLALSAFGELQNESQGATSDFSIFFHDNESASQDIQLKDPCFVEESLCSGEKQSEVAGDTVSQHQNIDFSFDDYNPALESDKKETCGSEQPESIMVEQPLDLLLDCSKQEHEPHATVADFEFDFHEDGDDIEKPLVASKETHLDPCVAEESLWNSEKPDTAGETISQEHNLDSAFDDWDAALESGSKEPPGSDQPEPVRREQPGDLLLDFGDCATEPPVSSVPANMESQIALDAVDLASATGMVPTFPINTPKGEGSIEQYHSNKGSYDFEDWGAVPEVGDEKMSGREQNETVSEKQNQSLPDVDLVNACQVSQEETRNVEVQLQPESQTRVDHESGGGCQSAEEHREMFENDFEVSQRVVELETQLEKSLSSYKDAHVQIVELQKLNNALQARINELTSGVDDANSMRNEVKTLKNKCEEFAHQIGELHEEKQVLRNEGSNISKRMQATEQLNKKLEAQVHELTAGVDDSRSLQNQIIQLQTNCDEAARQTQLLGEEKQVLIDEGLNMSRRVQAAEQLNKGLQARIDELTAGADDSKSMQNEMRQLHIKCEESGRQLQELREEKQGLIEEGMKMSKRVLAVEQRMKEALAESRRSESQVNELEGAKKTLQEQTYSLTSRAEAAEALVSQQKGELKLHAKEVEKLRAEMQAERSRFEGQDRTQQDQKRDFDERIAVTTGKLENFRNERDELIATTASLRVERDRALLERERMEARLQHHLAETSRNTEEQRKRELEFQEQNVPLTQRISELEMRLGEQELSEADVRRDLEAAHARYEAARDECKQSIHARDVQANEIERITLEHASTASQIAEACAARNMAEQSREDIKMELQSVNVRCHELAEQVASLTQQLLVMQEMVSNRAMEEKISGHAASDESDQMQIQTLQSEVAMLRSEARVQSQTPQRQFELALQAIGQLQEELETCKDERDQYREYNQKLVKAARDIGVSRS